MKTLIRCLIACVLALPAVVLPVSALPAGTPSNGGSVQDPAEKPSEASTDKAAEASPQTPPKAVPKAAAQKAPDPTIEIEAYQPENDLFLERGAKFTILIKNAEGAGLRAIYRPTSKVEKVEEIGSAKEGKSVVVWTPTQAGLARLEVYLPKKADSGEPLLNDKGEEIVDVVLVSRVVSIKLGPGFPIGLVIMILAGAILFFGAFVSIQALLRS